MRAVRAVCLAAEARHRLARAGGTGRVHSAFARTINLTLDGLGDLGWLSLHGPGPIPSPFGIACPALSIQSELAGAAVRLESGAVVLKGWLRVELADAAVADTALPGSAPYPPITACLADAGRRVTDGLLPVVAARLEGAPLPATPLAAVASPALARLEETTATGDATAWLVAATRLLGLGPGLTPSGDDCLVGWLAGARASGPRGQRLAATVGATLVAVAVERTTPLSRAFLAAAAAGHVAVPVREFVTSPDEPRLRGLLAVGETSGADVLAGYLLARHALGRGGSSPWRERDPA